MDKSEKQERTGCMKTLIEFQDYDVLTNMSSILSVRPHRVIFIYDRKLTHRNSIQYIFEACKKHLPNLEHQDYSVNSANLEKIYEFIKKVVEESEECMIDLTGGSELMIIAGYKAGIDTGAGLIYGDLIEKNILDVVNNNIYCPFAEIELEDYVAGIGACLLRNSHLEPDEDDYDSILKMSRTIFENLHEWSRTCNYFQKVMSKSEDSLDFKSKEIIISAQDKQLSPDLKMLNKIAELGFIKNLKTDNGLIAFEFKSKIEKQYLLTYGIWLELYVYMSAKAVNRFDDVRLGTVIDWTAHDGLEISGNEIDVLLMKNSAPVLISCKLTEPDAGALNEILVTAKRLGGLHAKSILVTYSDIKKNNMGIYKKSKELGILIFDKTDILKADFGEQLNLELAED